MTKANQLKKKQLKGKKCAFSGCDEMFIPLNVWHKCHHWKCAISYQKEVEAKRRLKENRKALKEFRDGDIPHLKMSVVCHAKHHQGIDKKQDTIKAQVDTLQ